MGSEDAKDLMKKIFVCKISLRLGCLEGGISDIKNHLWLKDMDFRKLSDKKLDAPWLPKPRNELDVSEFDDLDEEEVYIMRGYGGKLPLTGKEQEKFFDFDKI